MNKKYNSENISECTLCNKGGMDGERRNGGMDFKRT